jgi:arginine/lysine/ornithine decarboxylase
MDHSRAPVLEALAEFHQRGIVVYGPPGHKQGRGTDPRVLDQLGRGIFEHDVLSLNGFDDRRESHGVLSDAQDLMADAVRADKTFFSTCGSSLSVKTAMISVAGPGEKLLVSRNAHKSVMAGIIISGIQPIWVHPHWDEDRQLAHPPEPDDVRRSLQQNPDAKGMLLITPTDWGTCADIAGVAEVCHEFDVPLIVDEAWGAHLPFHDGLPTWGMDAGADVVVTSVHKMGGGLEQSSVFQLQGDRVNPDVLKQREDLLGTTSSSSLIFAVLDGWRRQMVEQGSELLEVARQRAERLRPAIASIDGLEVMGHEVIGPGQAFDVDPLVLSIDVRGLGISGYQATEWMRENCNVALGASDAYRTNARITHADDDDLEKLLLEAMQKLAAEAETIEKGRYPDLPRPGSLELETALLPREAFFGPVEQIPIEEAEGRIAAEMASPYPPGVPAVAPGERINREVIDYLRTGIDAGMMVPDSADPSLKTLRVVVE